MLLLCGYRRFCLCRLARRLYFWFAQAGAVSFVRKRGIDIDYILALFPCFTLARAEWLRCSRSSGMGSRASKLKYAVDVWMRSTCRHQEYKRSGLALFLQHSRPSIGGLVWLFETEGGQFQFLNRVFLNACKRGTAVCSSRKRKNPTLKRLCSLHGAIPPVRSPLQVSHYGA